jgi:hypothetical protein
MVHAILRIGTVLVLLTRGNPVKTSIPSSIVLTA